MHTSVPGARTRPLQTIDHLQQPRAIMTPVAELDLDEWLPLARIRHRNECRNTLCGPDGIRKFPCCFKHQLRKKLARRRTKLLEFNTRWPLALRIERQFRVLRSTVSVDHALHTLSALA